MSFFMTLIYLGIKRIFLYPWAFILSLVVDPIVLVLNILVFTTLYHYNQGQAILGYSLGQMIWYFAATTLIWHLVYNFTDQSMAARIMQGDLSQDLLRPVSIFTWELGPAVSLRLSGVILEFIPSLIIFSLVFWPDFMSAAALLRFILAASMAFLLFFIINFLSGLSTFYFQSARALLALKHIVVTFLAGAFIPLEFFPSGVQRVLNNLPFPYLFYWPVQFLLNRGAAGTWDEFLLREGIALFWLIILFILSELVWRQAVRRYTDVRG